MKSKKNIEIEKIESTPISTQIALAFKEGHNTNDIAQNLGILPEKVRACWISMVPEPKFTDN